MKAYDVTNQDAYRMLRHVVGNDANMNVAKALRFVIQSMAEKYPDTNDIPDSEWSDVVAVAFEHANR